MQEVYVERLTLRPTLACNFHCKLCNEFSPYYHSPRIPPVEEVERDIDRTFSLIDRVRCLEISGGEPLLYKPLPQLLRHIYQYTDRYALFSLVTNGSLLFREETIAALQLIGSKVRVIVDDYGGALSKQAHANAELLENAGIRYELRDQYANVHEDGWIDFSDLRWKHNEADAKKLFKKCVCPQKLHWVVTLHQGRLYPCHVLRRCTELGIVPETPSECINIYDPNLDDLGLKRNILGLYTLDVLSACQYCVGFLEESERKRPAEQKTIGNHV